MKNRLLSSLARRLSVSALFAIAYTFTYAQSTIVLDQISPLISGSASLGSSGLSQYYSASGLTANDGGIVDNFTLSSATTLTNVSALVGMVNPVTPIVNWQVNIYSSFASATTSLTGDVASVLIAPGGSTFDTTGVPLYHGVAQAGILSLPVSIDLPTGTFYVSVIGVADYAGGGYRIYSSQGLGGQDAFIANPGESNPGISSYGMYGDASYSVSGVSAIPEPSTYAAIAGAMTLGLAVWNRRRKNAAATPVATAA